MDKCIMDTCIMDKCIMDTCTMDTCIMGTYIMDTSIMDICIMDTSAWVTRPERPKGAKDEVREARRAADWKLGPEGPPKLLVDQYFYLFFLS